MNIENKQQQQQGNSIFSPSEDETTAKEGIQTIQEEKPGVFIWNYQNTSENEIRYVAFDGAPLTALLKDKKLSREDVEKLVWMMDRTVAGIIETFDLFPKDPNYDNLVKPGETHKDITTNVVGEQVQRLSDS